MSLNIRNALGIGFTNKTNTELTQKTTKANLANEPAKDTVVITSKPEAVKENFESKKSIVQTLKKEETIKPLELVKRHLLHTTQENDIVADFFLGSGTTCVAAKELKRRYIGFEIDKQYFKIAKDRLNGINKNGQTSIFTDFEQLEKERELIGTTL
jgi:DNA modification methylase